MSIDEYIAKSREHHTSDEDIKQKLLAAGWNAADIDAALKGEEPLEVPQPPQAAAPQEEGQAPNNVATHKQAAHQPLAVVENLSPRGFEFKIYAVSLLASLISITVIVNSSIYGESEAVAFPATVLLVTGPLMLYLFNRLRKAERVDPKIYADPSRRKSVQAIQLITFLIVITHTIVFLYGFISGSYTDTSSPYSGYEEEKSIFKDSLSWLTSVVVNGFVFAYYWRQEHKLVR